MVKVKSRRRKRNCIFGHSSVVERKQQHRHYITKCSNKGIQCTSCSRFACNTCLKQISEKFEKVHLLSDTWCQQVKSYIDDGSLPVNFVGNCCEFRSPTNDVYEGEEPLSNNDITISGVDLSGYLCLPEYGLLINPPFNSIDVHIFSNNRTSAIDGVYHSVVKKTIGNISPDGSASRLISHRTPYSIKLNECDGILSGGYFSSE